MQRRPVVAIPKPSAIAVAVVACVILTLLSPGTAGAVDFFVNSIADTPDNLPGDGICAGGVPIPRCTLRAAVEEANALAGADRVFVGERTVTVFRQIEITDHLDIVGVDAWSTELRADNSLSTHRFFEVPELVVVEIRDLAMRGAVNAPHSGAIASAGILLIERVWFDGNTSGASGGAIGTFGGASGTGSLHLHDSTFSDNQAGVGGSGGALQINGATVTVVNTTFVGNAAGAGGAIRMVGSSASLELVSSTLAYNVDSNPAGHEASAITVGAGDVHVDKTIVIGSCAYDSDVTRTSDGSNVESPGATCMLGVAGDQLNLTRQEVALAQLADWGGPLPTMLPAAASVAVDPGLSFVECPDFDARGEPRIDGGGCDAGAVERQPGDPETPPFFADGFESGDTSTWSRTVPTPTTRRQGAGEPAQGP